tara:strand:+ start:6633 stop:8093 length:1461 start_codon:yes stop_codon:yes gene_type:complete
VAITVTLQGVDITSSVDFRSVSIQDTMEATGDSMRFNVYSDNGSVSPAVGNEVILTDGSTKEFAGVLTDMRREMLQGNKVILFACTATDYTYLLDRRYVNGVYSSDNVSTGDKSNHGVLEQILFDLKVMADADSDDGDQFYNAFYNNISTTYIKTGSVINQKTFQRVAPSSVFSTLAQATAMLWWIDFDKRVNFVNLAENTATHLPLDDGSRTLIVDTDVINYRDFTLEDSIKGLGTKAIIKDAIVKSTENVTHPSLSITTANIDNLIIPLERRPYDQYSIVSVIRNRGGVYQTMTQQLDGIHRTEDDYSAVDNTYFLYVGRQGTNSSYIRIPKLGLTDNAGNPNLAVNDYINITYKASFQDEHENINQTRIADAATATGGDGVHEFVFSKNSEIQVANIDDLDEIGSIILDRKSKIMKRGSFTSLTKGWRAGQYFYIKWNQQAVNEAVWAISVTKRILTPQDANAGDNIIESTINFANMPRGIRL